jgi:hypothetical protein
MSPCYHAVAAMKRRGVVDFRLDDEQHAWREEV